MALANVNLGSGPSAGDGSPLRTAFGIINNNFAQLQSNVSSLTNSVTAVAGRTGNVVLTVNDIVGLSLYPNNSTISTWISANIAALVGTAPTILDTLGEIADAINDDANVYTTLINSITSANVGMKGYVDFANTVQAGAILAANLGVIGYVDNAVTTANTGVVGYVDDAVTTANTGVIGYVDNAVTTANIGMKGYVDSQSHYSNINLKSYLSVVDMTVTPTANLTYNLGSATNRWNNAYVGNVNVSKYVVFNDQSEQYTAWTGSETRTVFTSNVRYKPTWLSYYPGGDKNTIGSSFGFDYSIGMFFAGNADYPAYPIRMNTPLHEDDRIEVTATIDFDDQGDDNSIAIFLANVEPRYSFTANNTRISWNSNFGTPAIYGLTGVNTAVAPVLTAGNWYTIKFVYDRNANAAVTVYTYSGNAAVGTPIDTRSLNERLPHGIYTVGFDGDNDQIGNNSKFANLTVKTINDAVARNLEVTGSIISGNIIPQANVAYSLGNVTHQWKDLYLSGNTLHMGGATFSVSGGVINTSLPIAGNLQTSNLTITGANISFSNGAYIEESEISGLPGYYGLALNSSNDGVVGINAVDTDANIATSVIASNTSVTVNTNDSSNVAITHSWNFVGVGGTGTLFWPDNTSQTTAWNESANAAIQGWTTEQITQANVGVVGYVDDAVSAVTFDQDLNTTDNVNFANIGTSTGQISVPTDTSFALRLNHSTHGEANVIVNSQGYMSITGAYTGRAFEQVYPGEGVIGYFGYSANVTDITGINGLRITTGVEGSGGTWAFGLDGVFTTPGDIDIGGRLTSTTGQLDLEAVSNPNAYIQLNNTGDSFFGANANVQILTDNDNNVWEFGTDGTLTLPGATAFVDASANFVGIYSNASQNNGIELDTADTNIFNTGNVNIYANVAGSPVKTWTFDNTGGLTFPDLTVQITAWNSSANAAIIGYVDNQLTSYAVNVAIQGWTTEQITQANVGIIGYIDSQEHYSNVNLASYQGNIQAQVNGYDIGYRDIPQVSAGNVTLALSDRGKHYYATSAAPLTLTVPSNANVAFPIGTAISIVNKGTANLTVALEAEASMYLAGNATSASRTITSYGMATLMKTATDEWFINGTGVS